MALGPRTVIDDLEGRMSLFWRVFLVNAVTLGVAGVVLALSPATISYPVSYLETLTLVAGIFAMFAINAAILTRVTRPLHELRRSIEAVHSPTTDQTIRAAGEQDEVGRLAGAYVEMLARLEEERASSVRRSLGAQEAERSRIARELHDEIGQGMTVLLLRLGMLRDQVPEERRAEVDELSEALRATLEEVRSISARLRPGVLDDLGLRSALQSLVHDARAHGHLDARAVLDPLPPLSREHELVVYRVAQEAVTNVLRHARASSLDVELRAAGGTLSLVVRDDGTGERGEPGVGTSGMLERARLVQGRLSVTAEPGVGTTVGLTMPLIREEPDGDAPLSPRPRPRPPRR